MSKFCLLITEMALSDTTLATVTVKQDRIKTRVTLATVTAKQERIKTRVLIIEMALPFTTMAIVSKYFEITLRSMRLRHALR